MKWIGQHIWDFVSRFRNDVYLEDLTEVEQEFTIQVAADGKLTKSTAPSERSRLQVRNDEGSVIPAGAPLYSRGEIGGSNRIKVGICVSSDPAKMPCIGIAQFEMNTSNTKDSFAITQGVYNTNISGFTGLNEGDILYVNGGVAPYLTQTKPTNGDLIQNVGVVLKTNGTICQGLLVSAIGRTNDVPWPLYVDHATQRVSIGTSSPTVPFHVIGDTRIQGNLTVNGTYTQIDTDVNTTEQWLVTNDGTGPAAIINQLGSQDIFDVQDDGTSVFYIEDGGQIGIGTTNPTARLHIESADDVVVRLKSTDNKAYIALSDNDTDGYISSENSRLSLGANPYADANNLNIDLSNNNVGIGTTSPSRKLEVYNSSSSMIGQFRSGSGTSSFICFANTASTADQVRIGSISSNLVLSTNYTERMRIDSSGNVGIGTTSPSYPLHVATESPTPAVYIKNNDNNANGLVVAAGNGGGGTNTILSLRDKNDNPKFSVIENGNIGIGTTTPTSKLHVSSGGSPSIIIQDTDGTDQYATINHNNGANQYIARNNTSNGQHVWFGQTGTSSFNERMRINSSGNVGIGTSSPSVKLHIQSADETVARIERTSGSGYTVLDIKDGVGTTGNSVLRFSDTTASNGYINYEHADDSMRFGASASEAMRITSNGNVGIGTSTPNKNFTVEWEDNNTSVDTGEGLGGGAAGSGVLLENTSSTVNSYANLDFRSNNADGRIAYKYNSINDGDFHFITDNGNNPETKLFIKSSGEVGIGTSSPQQLLDITNTTAAPVLRLSRNQNISSTSWAGQSLGDIEFYTNDSSSAAVYGKISVVGGPDSGTPNVGYPDGHMTFFTRGQQGGDSLSERMRITDTGSVGIGTTSPSSTLNINGGTGGLSTGLTFGDGDTGIWESVDDVLRFSTASTTRVLIDSSGNVGIGTTSPSNKLDVAGDLSATSIRIGSSASGEGIIRHNAGSGNGVGIVTGSLNSSSIGLFVDHSSNNRNVGIGTTAPSEKLEVNGNIKVGDNNEVRFGAASDLRIFHNGALTYLSNQTGDLYIRNQADDKDIIFQSDNGSGGLATYLQLDGSSVRTRAFKDVNFDDNVQATFGASSDLKIYHDGSNSYIKDSGTGNLYTLTNAYRLTNAAGNENMIWAAENSFVKLYYDNSEKLATTSTGVEVTGNIALTGSVQKQISTSTHTINFGAAGSSTQNYFLPFVQQTEQAAPNNTHRMVVPYDGIIKKVIVHSKVAFGSSATVRYHRIDNGNTADFANDGSTDDVTTDVSRDMSTAYAAGVFNFTTGNTFSAGDQIALSFIRGNTALGDVVVTVVYEYELF